MSNVAQQAEELHALHPDREIQEDVLDVPLIAWLGVVSSILIAVAVILLTGVFYLTEGRQMQERHAQADARITDLEAHRAIDAMVVDGYFKHPDSDDGQGNIERGTVSIPVEIGMRQVVESSNQ